MSMSNEEGRSTDDVRMLIKTLAHYVARGYPLDFYEPPVRGSKGPSRDSRRSIGFTVGNPQVFDNIRWELIKQALRSRQPG
jgi:hypothetical protein